MRPLNNNASVPNIFVENTDLLKVKTPVMAEGIKRNTF